MNSEHCVYYCFWVLWSYQASSCDPYNSWSYRWNHSHFQNNSSWNCESKQHRFCKWSLLYWKFHRRVGIILTFHSSLIGPLIGGYLNKEEYIQPIVDRFPIFRDHPYLFPLLIVSIVFAIITILVIFLCKETLPKAERLNSHAKDLARLESESQDLEASLLDKSSFKKPTVFSLLMERNTFLLVTAYSTAF